MKRFVFSFLALGTLWASLAFVPAPTAVGETFKDGQTICFYGDSITHGGRFHYVIFDYYLTRYPESVVSFFNAGVAGDNAGAAMTRIEEDVLVRKPDVVALMFGMNDVWRGSYVSNPSQDQLKRQVEAIAGYEHNMKRLTERLRTELNPVFYFITPSPFDDTGLNDRDNNQPGCNSGLGKCAEIVKSLAASLSETGAPGKVNVVDFHAPMTALNAQKQAEDPHWTIVGPDRVHPGAQGHLMMAWLFLKEQGAPAVVSDVVLDCGPADGKQEDKQEDGQNSVKVVKAENAEASDLKREADGAISCTIFEKALPFPIDPEAYPVLELLPIVQDLNQERFAVKNLAVGNYELFIDGASVGTFTANELSDGINLAMNEKTPQFQQAQEVRRLGVERRGTECILREYAAVRWYLRRYVNPDDLTRVKKFYDEEIPNRTGYFESKVPRYLAEWEQRGEIEKKLAEETAEILKKRQPTPHRYLLKQAK